MKKLAIAGVASLGLLLAACNHTPGARITSGALVGGAAGAGIGQAIGGNTESTVAGAAIGAGTGAAIAAANEPRYCTTYDRYGQRYDYRC
ncbi:MAG: hypothetical protein Q8P46_02265 [Hyphomicrobiales bacterium]|nr:hypothetical protein [Hyphomicrobiales bacterium]